MNEDLLDPVKFINEMPRMSGRVGLHRMRALCQALGNPQDRLRFVHLAGTNGKGSVATMLQRSLTYSGYRTGLYISPYIVRFHERMQVDGAMIADEDLARLSERVSLAVQSISLPAGECIGQFEFITAVAFLYFLEQECDFVVLEAGIGGRFDATNVIKSTQLTVFTPISWDHMDLLGDTIGQIAAEKAAIIKKGCAVVSACTQPPEAQLEIERSCMEQGATLYEYDTHYKLLRLDPFGSAFVYGGQGYRTAMAGRHQIDNALLAIGALEALSETGVRIEPYAVVHGIASARLPGRLHAASEEPLILIDGAHNEAGVTVLLEAMRTLLPARHMHVIMGMVEDKAYESCISRMARRAHVFYACEIADNPRALSSIAMERIAREHCETVQGFSCLAHALDAARAQVAPSDYILICGSLFLAGEAERIFRSDKNRQN